ncbi:thioredoxin family protein [Dactylosporangium sp. NPDC000555]|uniref:thioredoxin family protein n=1 Tax=Dactylosporangium sp. NPDC000555 TaxID=3154260 RepID=UPI003332A9F5
MQVTLWYFADCPNWRVADDRLRRALDETGNTDAEVRLMAVETEEEASAVGFAGSPSFTVDGVDLFDGARPAGTLACRVYNTPTGLAGVPEVADLVAALAARRP